MVDKNEQCRNWSLNRPIITVARLWAGQSEVCDQITAEARDFLFSTASRPPL